MTVQHDVADTNDPYLWLEDVGGERALEWVKQRNRETLNSFTQSDRFKASQQEIEALLNADDRIPYLSKVGEYYYNFWQDESHPRGLVRRTSLSEYQKENTQWEIVLDVDRLAARDKENWVYKGSQTLRPTFDRALTFLSRGGADASIMREFDRHAMQFLESGFVLPEAKSDVAWLSKDELLVATDFGPGTLTESGYARIVKRWRRGEPLAEATTVFEADATDVMATGWSSLSKDYSYAGVVRALDFYTTEMYLLQDGELTLLDKPLDASVDFHRGWLTILLKSDWTVGEKTYETGTLLITRLDDHLAGERDFQVLFEPSFGTSLLSYSYTRNHILLNSLNNVRNTTHIATSVDGRWSVEEFSEASGFKSTSVYAVDGDEDDRFFMTTDDWVTPPTLSIGSVGGKVELLKQEPERFNAAGLTISQHWVDSADGTRIPYFQVSKQELDEPQPTLLYGYGGFQASMLPGYQSVTGKAWLERGGVYVVANIRGGGEFGPEWHQAALKEQRPRAFEDFIAVAEDLLERNVATAELLCAMGGSNGGLLMGNMLTRRPDLFKAIVAQVPLFDMQRYHLLLAGASWMAEYGDPDIPEEWEFMKGFSPYHNLDPDTDYPRLLVTTSTRDDRVHPGHARKLVAKMRDMGKDVTYYENIEGGHAGAADNSQRAFMNALSYEFLWQAVSAAKAQ